MHKHVQARLTNQHSYGDWQSRYTKQKEQYLNSHCFDLQWRHSWQCQQFSFARSLHQKIRGRKKTHLFWFCLWLTCKDNPCIVQKMVCKPLWYTCILSSGEIWSYQSTMTSAVSKMIAQWMSPLAGFFKAVETQFEYMPACAMLCTLLEQSLDSISKEQVIHVVWWHPLE